MIAAYAFAVCVFASESVFALCVTHFHIETEKVSLGFE